MHGNGLILWLICSTDHNNIGHLESLKHINVSLKQSIEEFKSDSLKSYSPIFRAYPDLANPIPTEISKIEFIFCTSPSYILSRLKLQSRNINLSNVFFTIGHAGLVLINNEFDLQTLNGTEFLNKGWVSCIETWILDGSGVLERTSLKNCYMHQEKETFESISIDNINSFRTTATYLQQIETTLNNLIFVQNHILPFNVTNFTEIAEKTNRLAQAILTTRETLSSQHKDSEPSITKFEDLRKVINSYKSLIIEISAALSYVDTQGLAGIYPILNHPAPFPHHKLLGIGKGINTLSFIIKFIVEQLNKIPLQPAIETYTHKEDDFYHEYINYSSDESSKFITQGSIFDQINTANNSGSKGSGENARLLPYFSLRHGFKESRTYINAASESLTHCYLPEWTLMTLTHELMHSRVRQIVEYVMGIDSSKDPNEIHRIDGENYYNWNSSPRFQKYRFPIRTGLRQMFYYFVVIWEFTKSENGRSNIDLKNDDYELIGFKIRELYKKHDIKAIELLVHFHDYYFVFNNNDELYFKSILISWGKVYTAYADPNFYLIRCLAILAVGNGENVLNAYISACDRLREIVQELIDNTQPSEFLYIIKDKIDSHYLSATASDENKENNIVFKLFRISYLFLDTYAKYFYSGKLIQLFHFNEVYENWENKVFECIDAHDKQINPLTYNISYLKESLSNFEQGNEFNQEEIQWKSAWGIMTTASLG